MGGVLFLPLTLEFFDTFLNAGKLLLQVLLIGFQMFPYFPGGNEMPEVRTRAHTAATLHALVPVMHDLMTHTQSPPLIIASYH
jgi:hypothetical protein